MTFYNFGTIVNQTKERPHEALPVIVTKHNSSLPYTMLIVIPICYVTFSNIVTQFHHLSFLLLSFLIHRIIYSDCGRACLKPIGRVLYFGHTLKASVQFFQFQIIFSLHPDMLAFHSLKLTAASAFSGPFLVRT